MKAKLIWRLILIIGWFIFAWLAFIDLPKDLIEGMYFICCLLLFGYNVEKLIDGR